MTTTPPANGLYNDVPMPDYLGWEALSSSGLATLIRRSPAHYRAAMDSPKQDTAATSMGTAIHAATLEPEEFERRFYVAPKVDRRTTAGKARAAEIEAEAGTRTIINDDDHALVIGARASVWASKACRSVLSGSAREISCVYRTCDGTIPLKIRPDAMRIGNGKRVILPDIKSAIDAGRDAFSRAMFTYRYDLKMAFYRFVLRGLGYDVTDCILIAIEKEPPFAVAVYRLVDSDLDLVESDLYRGIAIYTTCSRSCQWGAYPDEFQDISIPDWAKRRIVEDSIPESNGKDDLPI